MRTLEDTGEARFTVSEVAARLGAPRSWVLEQLAAGAVPADRDWRSPAMIRAADIGVLRARWQTETGEVQRRA